MKIKLFFMALTPFVITLKYLILSYIYPKKITELKQRWAQSVLDYLGFKLVLHGKPPQVGTPVICVGNHFSFLDILVLMAAHPHVVFLSKVEVKNWPIIGQGAVRVGTLFVDRETRADRSVLRQKIGEELNEKKAHLVIFPSGTTTLDEAVGWKKGAFEIAKRSHVPVKLFKLSYIPFRESSYIDDDTIVGQTTKLLGIHNKSVTVSWLDQYTVGQALEDAEKLRQININHKV